MQSLRGSFSPRYELVTQLRQDVRLDDRSKRSNLGSGHVNDVPSLIGPGSRSDGKPLCKSHYQKLNLSRLEIMSLDRQAGEIGASVVHEPDGHGQRRQHVEDPIRHDLSSPGIETVMPLGENGSCMRDELHTGIPFRPEYLIELMERHGDEVTEYLPLQLCQTLLRQLVLDEQPMKSAMLRQAAVTQQGADQNLFLPTSQYIWSGTNFPRRYPLHALTVWMRCDNGLSPI